MVKKRQAQPPQPPQYGKDEALSRIDERISAGEELLSADRLSPEDMKRWWLVTNDVMEKSFGKGDSKIRMVREAGPPATITSTHEPEAVTQSKLKKRLEEQIRSLKECKKTF